MERHQGKPDFEDDKSFYKIEYKYLFTPIQIHIIYGALDGCDYKTIASTYGYETGSIRNSARSIFSKIENATGEKPRCMQHAIGIMLRKQILLQIPIEEDK